MRYTLDINHGDEEVHIVLRQETEAERLQTMKLQIRPIVHLADFHGPNLDALLRAMIRKISAEEGMSGRERKFVNASLSESLSPTRESPTRKVPELPGMEGREPEPYECGSCHIRYTREHIEGFYGSKGQALCKQCAKRLREVVELTDKGDN